MTTRVRLTYEDYAALPDDGRRYELHDGELSVTPSPGLAHQAALRNLVGILDGHVSAMGLGDVFPAPVDCILENVSVVQPDNVFVETARRSVMSERGIEGPPTLVVEIISPSSAGIDRCRKLQLYARYAVPLLLDRRSTRENDRGISARARDVSGSSQAVRDLERFAPTVSRLDPRPPGDLARGVTARSSYPKRPPYNGRRAGRPGGGGGRDGR